MMDLSPQDARNAILDAALVSAVFDGWTDQMIEASAQSAGLPKGSAALYFPDGVLEVITYWSERMDAAVEPAIQALDHETMKIRDRITQSVILRLHELDPHIDAARRAQARLSLPDGLATAAKIGWAASDMIWTAIGDKSDDLNYYSKRTILSAVMASTAAVWLNDTSPDKSEARAFLDRRIANVMQFETAKARARQITDVLPNPLNVLRQLGQRSDVNGTPTRRRKRAIRRGRG